MCALCLSLLPAAAGVLRLPLLLQGDKAVEPAKKNWWGF